MENFEIGILSDYESEPEEQAELVVNSAATTHKKRTRKDWLFECEFQNGEQAVAAVKEEKKWSFLKKRETNEGTKVEYRCNQVKLRGNQCASAVLLVYYHDRLAVGKYVTAADHTCSESDTARRNGIAPLTKDLIDTCVKQSKILLYFNKFHIQYINISKGISCPSKIISSLKK
jgi:hypothetical protein